MMDKIVDVLRTAGLSQVPSDPDASLEAYGLDSLTVILCVDGLEKSFGICIPAREFDVRHFATLNTLQAFVRQQVMH